MTDRRQCTVSCIGGSPGAVAASASCPSSCAAACPSSCQPSVLRAPQVKKIASPRHQHGMMTQPRTHRNHLPLQRPPLLCQMGGLDPFFLHVFLCLRLSFGLLFYCLALLQPRQPLGGARVILRPRRQPALFRRCGDPASAGTSATLSASHRRPLHVQLLPHGVCRTRFRSR